MPPRTFDQAGFDVRFDWGIDGLAVLGRTSEVVIVVDVLSFSTAVDVATSRGAAIFPAPWKDDRATTLAHSVGAVLAVPRSEMSARTPYSLSPASFSSVQAGSRIVLPSPNGATISLRAESPGLTVIAGCLRNAAAVARAASAFGRRVSVIAAGERWPGGTLRPAVEDLVGAGAIIAALDGSLSPEASAAAGAFRAVDVIAQLAESASGRELVDAGFPADVELAAMLNASRTVPVLREGAFTAHSAAAKRGGQLGPP
jgi:2-phosphosulfolactate phosphatase